jgi:hypothetical protein
MLRDLCALYLTLDINVARDRQTLIQPFTQYFILFFLLAGTRGGVVVEALCYKLEGREFDTR